jgi:type IV pilus assembly protein PilB
MKRYRRLGEMLQDRGILTHDQLEQALKVYRKEYEPCERRIGEALTELGMATEEDVTSCLAEQYELPVVDPLQVNPSPDALHSIPRIVAMGRLILPISLDESEYRCVVADPIDVELTDALNRTIGRKIRMSLATPSKLRRRIAECFDQVRPEAPAPSKKSSANRRSQDAEWRWNLYGSLTRQKEAVR